MKEMIIRDKLNWCVHKFSPHVTNKIIVTGKESTLGDTRFFSEPSTFDESVGTFAMTLIKESNT